VCLRVFCRLVWFGARKGFGDFAKHRAIAPRTDVVLQGALFIMKGVGSRQLHSESESDLFTGTIHGNTDCYLQFCAGRTGAAAETRPASAWAVRPRSISPVCSLPRVCLSIYRYSKSCKHYSMRPRAPPSPGRHPVVSSYLAGAAFAVPRCHRTVVVVRCRSVCRRWRAIALAAIITVIIPETCMHISS
jgi:hypothetical protein